MTHYHLIGIGGIGMSGLARILKDSGYSVSGSDVHEGETVLALRDKGIPVFIGHAASHVPEGARLVYSTDISPFNPEMVHAKQFQLPILHRSHLLHELMKDSRSLLVTGTHGKTTTSSLLAHTLIHAGWDPSFAIGGVLTGKKVNAAKGQGGFFVAEADESDGSFLVYTPFGAIITNISHDHMNHFQTEENLLKAFQQFGKNVVSKSHLFYCCEDPLAESCAFEGVGYGFKENAALRGMHFHQKGWKIVFDAVFCGKTYPHIEVSLSGYHNALNALAVFGLCLSIGMPENKIREGFKTFQGVKRRFELKGELHEFEVRDDYGHHPKEIEATLKGIKRGAPDKRLLVVFQPHRYTRTRDCLLEFRHCFDAADHVLLTDIYAAQEKPIEGVHATNILQEVKNFSRVPIEYVPADKLEEKLFHSVRPFDLVLTMGAGNIWQTGESLLKKLKVHPLKKWKLGLVFGGRSLEHEISIKSFANVFNALDKQVFDICCFYIARNGSWHLSETEVLLPRENPALTPEVLNVLNQCEVVFPLLHGTKGEDGTIQGLFEMMDIPYVGCNHLASAICMDKMVTKKLAEAAGVMTAPFVDFSKIDWEASQREFLYSIESKLPYPLYVKPVHLGSAVGVTKVVNRMELCKAVEEVFKMDYHVIVEKEIVGRELEFSVFGAHDIQVFPPGEILKHGACYDYEAKYGANSFKTAAQADLSKDLIEQGMRFAKSAYLSAGCDGYARVDFFLDQENRYYLNEINPIPGFTGISLFPKMCGAAGIDTTRLLSTLTRLAFVRHRDRKRLL